MESDETVNLAPIENYLNASRIPVRLACTTEAGWPYILSLWYIYLDGAIYCATQASARIVTFLRNSPACAYEIASDLPPYCGVRGRARAKIEANRGPEILNLLLKRYLQNTASSLAENLLSRSDTEVAIRLEPLSLYAWNFTSRMKDSVPSGTEKPCPPDI